MTEKILGLFQHYHLLDLFCRDFNDHFSRLEHLHSLHKIPSQNSSLSSLQHHLPSLLSPFICPTHQIQSISTIHNNNAWTPESWKHKKAPQIQLPEHPDEKVLESTAERLGSLLQMVFEDDVRRLEERLADVGMGKAFLLHGVGRGSGQDRLDRSTWVKPGLTQTGFICLGVPDCSEITQSCQLSSLGYLLNACTCPAKQALTRKDSESGLYYDCSTHMLWVGERTQQLDGAHVEFLRGVRYKMNPKELVKLIEILNPQNKVGKITLATRMRPEYMRVKLPHLIKAVRASGQFFTSNLTPSMLFWRKYEHSLMFMNKKEATQAVFFDEFSNFRLHNNPRLNTSELLELALIHSIQVA
ncbi:hypothetical protein Sjap_026249 [Stephania japonica]|uniref:Phospho-2-dehydro-3-deoxyheptonate aldolase n=1 Tax=Stephania japonica TaxID=461633 RepID=A0AAP0EB21_9MAGN